VRAGFKAAALLGTVAIVGGCGLMPQPGIELDFFEPALSPDGNKIAFVAEQEEAYELFLLDIEQGEERMLTQTERQAFSPSWSPEGDYIAFMAMGEEESSDIFTVEVATGEIFRVTSEPSLDFYPMWSENGEIVFISDREGPWTVFSVQPDGTELRRLGLIRPESDGE